MGYGRKKDGGRRVCRVEKRKDRGESILKHFTIPISESTENCTNMTSMFFLLKLVARCRDKVRFNVCFSASGFPPISDEMRRKRRSECQRDLMA